MLHSKLRYKGLLFLVLLILIIPFFFRDNIYIMYIKMFKKTALIKHYNENGNPDGKVYGFLNGNLSVTSNYVDGLKEGLTTEYYKNGQIETLSFFKHGKREGEGTGYYCDGKLNYSGGWKNDKKYGSGYHYSTNGKVTNYVGIDIVNVFFYMEYNAAGQTTKAFGNCFSENIFSNDIKTDSTIILADHETYQNIKDLNITVATPPNLTPLMSIFINNKFIPNIKIKDNTVTLRNILINKGIYNVKIIGQLVNPQQRIIRANMLNFSVKKN